MFQKPFKFLDRHEWTMVHSHYLAMGGFALDISDKRLQFLEDEGYKQFTLTKHGFFWVADNEIDLIPDLSKTDIQDKSKANGLAKTLVCLQAIWFCIQCIVRLTQGLTISLLELNTFAYALCTLLIYVLWWDKPLDIGSQTLLQGPGSKELAALMLVHSMADQSFARKVQHSKDYYHTVDLSSLFQQPNQETGRAYSRFSLNAALIISDPIVYYHMHPKKHTKPQESLCYGDPDNLGLQCLQMALEEQERRNLHNPILAPLDVRIWD